MSEIDATKCAHENCNCRRRQDSKYCSAYCEGAKDTTEIGCGCAHPECSIGVRHATTREERKG